MNMNRKIVMAIIGIVLAIIIAAIVFRRNVINYIVYYEAMEIPETELLVTPKETGGWTIDTFGPNSSTKDYPKACPLKAKDRDGNTYLVIFYVNGHGDEILAIKQL